MDDNSTLMRLRERIADFRGRGIYAGWPNAHRAIFIHIPKTAGSSVTRALHDEPRANPHAPYREYERVNSGKFRKFFKFCFIRNPWDRVVSSYFFMRDGGAGDVDRQWAAHHLTGFDDFEGFVRGWLTRENIWQGVHFRPQYDFICDAGLRCRVDFVGRMETIELDFRHVCDRLNISGQLRRSNTSNHQHYSSYYSPELRDHVAAVYAEDIATFGYRF